METETRTTIRPNTAWSHLDVIEDGAMAVSVTRADLEALVQYAYDRHGIIASPSYALEAERATEPKPGQCPCGTEGCSDRDATEPDPTRDVLQRVFA